jgi:hypothetical protein
VGREPALSLKSFLTICAGNPVDVQLLSVLLSQMSRQVRLGNKGQGTVRAFETGLVLVSLFSVTGFAANVCVDVEGALVRIETMALGTHNPVCFF